MCELHQLFWLHTVELFHDIVISMCILNKTGTKNNMEVFDIPEFTMLALVLSFSLTKFYLLAVDTVKSLNLYSLSHSSLSVITKETRSWLASYDS